MSVEVNISSITGQSPYDIYICQTGATTCLYVGRITEVPYTFIIPKPYDKSGGYLLKLIDANGSIISGQTSVL
jgi:hypothetical protein